MQVQQHTVRASLPTSAAAAPAAARTGEVIDVATTPADLQAMGAVYRAGPSDGAAIGPVTGRYDLEIRFPGNGNVDRVSGTARLYHSRVGADEWALVPFFNPNGTGFMHQPAILHRTGGTWNVVADDPAPGEYHLHGIPDVLMRHWGIVGGMPPKDSVTNDKYPEDER